MKYIILSDSNNAENFEIPRQLSKINGETLIGRTIRLLKENGIKDILITSHDKKFDNLGAKRYEPLHNDYDPINKKGYWLSAFPIELLNESICFLFGDVYYSENAIKTIVNTETDATLFFCTYENKNNKYIKQHDEPLAYKVVDYELFKKHIDIVKRMKDNNLCCREPIVWELYRSINGLYINEHKMSGNYIAINDESCDVDAIDDLLKIKIKIGGIKMIKVEALEDFNLAAFDELNNIQRKRTNKNESGKLYLGDTFECTKEMCEYLTGNNAIKRAVVKIIEVEPEKEEKKEEEIKEEPIVKSTIEYTNEKVEPKAIIKPNKNKKKKKK